MQSLDLPSKNNLIFVSKSNKNVTGIAIIDGLKPVMSELAACAPSGENFYTTS